jgi:serine/threonine-protein kinase
MSLSSKPPADQRDAGSDPAPMIGREFVGRYLIEAEIGQGGIGVVHRAIDRKLDRAVALKLLRGDAVGPSQRPRFEREAKALAALSHPNVVAVLDSGVSDSTPYLVMELLEGRSLVEALGPQPLPREHAEAIVRQLLSALAYVHERGLVHRDLKPANVFLQRLPGGGEQVKLLDFGLAKFLDRERGGDATTLTRSGEVFGTPAYMPPEQWTGHPVDARADVYSAAVVCFELLAGRKPFQGDGQQMLRAQLIDAAPLLHEACPARVASPELERLLQRALAKQPHDRQRSGLELAAELETLPTPWWYEGAEATPERRNAATAARDALDLATAPTLEQRAPRVAEVASDKAPPRAASTDKKARRVASIPGAIAELLRRLVLASAWTLSIVSVFVIGVSATVIYFARDPDHPEQRAALQRALPPLREAVERGAAAAKTAVDDAVSGAAKRVAAALPQPPATAPQADAPITTAAPERARDPWRSPVPRHLRRLRARIEAGQRGDDAMLAELRRYNREQPGDPRGHLLLARLFVNRGAWNEAMAQYQHAFARDASSRGDPRMLQDLVRAAARTASSARAFELVVSIYGGEALDAITRARARARSPDERARLDRLARAVAP